MLIYYDILCYLIVIWAVSLCVCYAYYGLIEYTEDSFKKFILSILPITNAVLAVKCLLKLKKLLKK